MKNSSIKKLIVFSCLVIHKKLDKKLISIFTFTKILIKHFSQRFSSLHVFDLHALYKYRGPIFGLNVWKISRLENLFIFASKWVVWIEQQNN